MIEARLSQLAAALSPSLIKGDAGFAGVSTDTRTLKAGELFVALVGENFDAHEFLQVAKDKGASAAIVSREVAIELPQLVCANTEVALGQLAAWYRAGSDARVIGITGSNGKTTVKALAASIFSRAGRTHVNAGNLNNEIGLPISILRMPQDTEYAVLEMGAGKPGDIAYLANIAKPSITLVNNIAPAHLERMGSLDGVADTKGAIYDALPADGVAVINLDERYADAFRKRAGARRIVTFALDRVADVMATIESLADTSRFVLKIEGRSARVDLPLAGRHNVRNALAAAALAHAAGIPLARIAEGLEHVQGVAGRLTRHALPSGAVLIDDSYNANPGSVRAAIDTLALERGERWLVLGDMKELGEDAAALHAEVGAYAKSARIDRFVAVGTLVEGAARAFGEGAAHYAKQDDAQPLLREAATRGDVVLLVKGSRSSAMDRTVEHLLGGGHAA